MLAISIEELPPLIRLAHKAHTNVLVVGDPGVGKSQVIEGMKSETCTVHSMTGSSTIEEYINGIPQVEIGSKGYKQLEYIPSEWLVDIVLYGKEHKDHMQVLFLDEFNTADPQVLKTFLTILSERRVPTCGITLPNNLVIVAAMNPQDQNEGEPLIRPLVSRFLTVEVRSSLEQYRKYIAGKDSSLLHCDFELLDQPEDLTVVQKDVIVRSISVTDWGNFSDGAYHEINPRSMDNFFRALSWCKNKESCTPLLSEAFLGIKLNYPKTSNVSNSEANFYDKYLSAKELKALSKDDLLQYGGIIYRDGIRTPEARKARLTFLAECVKCGIDFDVQDALEGEK